MGLGTTSCIENYWMKSTGRADLERTSCCGSFWKQSMLHGDVLIVLHSHCIKLHRCIRKSLCRQHQPTGVEPQADSPPIPATSTGSELSPTGDGTLFWRPTIIAVVTSLLLLIITKSASAHSCVYAKWLTIQFFFQTDENIRNCAPHLSLSASLSLRLWYIHTLSICSTQIHYIYYIATYNVSTDYIASGPY